MYRMCNHRLITYTLLAINVFSSTLCKQDISNAAVQAYIYAYPLVVSEITKRVMTNVTEPVLNATKAAAPINQFSHSASFPSPAFTDIVRPNVDTLYSFAWLDLTREPIVLSLPNTHGRYYLMPLLDAWTNVFASLGSRTTGTQAQTVVIVGPTWKGVVPENVIVIHAPTTMVCIIGRTQTNGKKDYAYVHTLQQGYKLTPLHAWHKKVARSCPRSLDPTIDMHTAPVDQVARMSAQQFFSLFAQTVAHNPPPAQDHAMLPILKSIGIEPGQQFSFKALSPAMQQALENAVPQAQKDIAQYAQKLGTDSNGWKVLRSGIGSYGTDYITRAAVAFIGFGANLPEDALYPTTFTDSQGKLLHGSLRYRIHFNKNQIPPVNAFWSITMYNNKSFLVENPINRYALGDRDPLIFNKDGSLDIYIQHAMPENIQSINWLPAPADNFNLTMRLYWPKEEVLNGTWIPAPVQKYESS